MKEINTAEVFPTLRNISLSSRTLVACAAIAAAKAALPLHLSVPPVPLLGLSYHILSPFATETRKKPLTVISIWCYYSLVIEHKFYFIRSVSPFGDPRCEKMPRRLARHFLVEEGGFEPPKRIATDLQSAPFGHSGTPPYELVGAGGRTRTPDRLITNQLLYQLSYTSIPARPQRRLV